MKIGDRVVCVNNNLKGELILNREYIVYNMKKCSCGSILVDVGLILANFQSLYCVECKEDFVVDGINWCASYRFRKVEEHVTYVKLEIEVEEPCLN